MRSSRSVRGTPTWLRLATAVTVLAGLAFGALGLQGLTSRSAAVDRARTETADLVRLQTVRTKVVTADAAAGVDVLLGADQRLLTPNDYDFALQPAVIGVPIASRQADDGYPLAVVNLRLAQYVEQAGLARNLALTGQARPAAEALQTASDTLQNQILPRLLAVQSASEARLAADQDAAQQGPPYAYVGAALGLIALIVVQAWLTARTRRILNLPLAAAAMLLIGVTVAGLVIVAASQRRADEVTAGVQPVVRALVDARVAAFDARARETLSVVTQSVPAQEPTWQAAIARTRDALARAREAASPVPPQTGATAPRTEVIAAIGLLDDYEQLHQRLLAQAQAGDRTKQLLTATSPAAELGLPGAFDGFDVATGALLARQVDAADRGWSDAGANLALAGWLWLACGLAAALLAWRGLAARLREYD